MKAVFKRELRSYFYTMNGYIFIAVMVFFMGIYFMANNLYYGYPQFSYTLLSSTIIFLVAIPLLTMKSMAEERRNKTDQLLFTAPSSLAAVVVGKYLAMVTILAIPVAISCFCPLIIARSGTANLLADYSAILAFFLMGCAFVAIGMFISTLTESQVIAAVGGVAALMVAYLWGDLVSFLPDFIGDFLKPLAFQDAFYNFAQYSVFDLGGLLLYLSAAFVFVFLTIQTLQMRRWN